MALCIQYWLLLSICAQHTELLPSYNAHAITFNRNHSQVEP